MTESKREKFNRLAGPRADRVFDAFRVFGNLAAPAYDPDPEAVDLLLAGFTDSLNDLSIKFKGAPMASAGPPADKPAAPAEEISPAEGLALVRTGPKIGAALDAIEDGDTDTARKLLLEVLSA